MADVRCPMCSKPNAADAEVCAFCGARLKPLVLRPGGEAPAPKPETPKAEPGETSAAGEAPPDWLARIRAQVSEEQEPAEEEAPEEDWLARLRSQEAEAPEPVSAAPPPTPPAAEPAAPQPPGAPSVPDWLGRLREVDSGGEEGPPEGEVPDWLSEFGGEAKVEGEAKAPPSGPPPTQEVPEWLARIREHTTVPQAPAEAEPDEDWISGLREQGAGAPPLAREAKAAPEPPKSKPPTIPPKPGVVPEALKSKPMRVPPAEPPPEPTPSFEGEPGRPAVVWEPRAPEPARTPPPSRPPMRPPPSKPPTKPPLSPPPSKPPALTGQTPGLEGGLLEKPAWLEELSAVSREAPPSKPGLPHVPALIMGEEGAEPAPPEPQVPEAPQPAAEVGLEALEVPDWLSEVSAPEAGGKPEGEAKPDLAPATLPAWLEAMRPVETFRSIEIGPEEEQAVESAGPLAGLRGVLLAEPVVAIPRTASVSPDRLDVTERQYAQADLLRRLVEDEQREVPVVARRKAGLPFARWAIALAMLVGVMAPIALSTPLFPLPSAQPQELPPLINLVNALPADRPVLIVFDYEPGFSGELDAVAAPLLGQLMARRLRIATLSTRPTGPALAQNLMSQTGARFGYVDGQDFTQLGYLAGGTAAIQWFAAAPRDTVLSGFGGPELPDGTRGPSGWSSPVVDGVQRLSDFGMVAVITAGMESARAWAEQAPPWLGGRPLVMVATAGLEPLVRPYFEALHPQVNGVLIGLPSAVAYDVSNGQSGVAQTLWSAFGAGLLVAVLALAAGGAYGLAAMLLRRGRG